MVTEKMISTYLICFCILEILALAVLFSAKRRIFRLIAIYLILPELLISYPIAIIRFYIRHRDESFFGLFCKDTSFPTLLNDFVDDMPLFK